MEIGLSEIKKGNFRMEIACLKNYNGNFRSENVLRHLADAGQWDEIGADGAGFLQQAEGAAFPNYPLRGGNVRSRFSTSL